eukprot:CAMPEP_0116124234 /NCGR_PEP_ID=MMETSP0329-20121206/5174_1 /TAXON_ID=697910 /ORGANISM="Pseudo-nitzschia arenysensis, Strain B593" /LENGTH=871 /DNA_ID=CAMNT_0003618205 /DNA_START=253 /DNA_END=2868 /DNA_ORIENTATION=+
MISWCLLLVVVIGCLFITTTTSAESTPDNGSGDDDDDDDFVCNVYVAPSTLPGTGLGMYAGAKGYQRGEMITKSLGDHVIAIPDQKIMQSDTGLYDREDEALIKYFLWDQYTWTSTAFGIHFEHISKHDVEIASPGFGAAANSFMDFVNVEEGGVDHGLLPPEQAEKEDYLIHRSKDPGAGAFTTYHTRKAWAKQDIAPHSEFFVSYGNEWFLDRVWRIGTIPVEGDHDEAEWLWKIFCKEFLGTNVTFANVDEERKKELLEGLRSYNDETEDFQKSIRRFVRQTQDPSLSQIDDSLKTIFRDFWDEMVTNFGNEVWDDSRIMAALPREQDEYESMLDKSYIAVKQEKMARTPEWLEKHGTCADSVRIGRSSLSNKQAGHGAFAKTKFAEGEVVMAAPLIHIPDKAILDTYFEPQKAIHSLDAEDLNIDLMGLHRYNKALMHQYDPGIGDYKTGHQLLLNYVFSHRDSTMALSPYGPGVQLINHNQTLTNVKLQWAEPHRSNHHPELLEKSVKYINDKYPLGSVLGMEIVATKPIAKGEELFLDYGDEWEEAWQNHVQNWKAPPGSENYVSATDLNTRSEHLNKPLANWVTGDGKPNPFPKNVRLLINQAWFENIRKKEGDDFLTEEVMYNDFDYYLVEAVFKSGTIHNKYKYLVEDEKLFEKLPPKQQANILKDYELAVKQPDYVDTSADESVYDNTLYTVVARVPYEAHEERFVGEKIPTYESITARHVPRRALKFEDKSYTTDQFLDYAFRGYIRIPDELFPEAWKNLPTDKEKEEHYWKYKFNPEDPDRIPWFEAMEEEEAEDELAENPIEENSGDGEEIVYFEDDDEEEEEEEFEETTMSMYALLDEEEEGEGEYYDGEDDYHDEF